MLLLLLIWWALTEGDRSGIGSGLIITVLVTFISLLLFPAAKQRIHLIPFIAFLMFFIGRSVLAGIDVARRLLSPSLPVSPGYCVVNLGLAEGSPRWLLANTMSLMPGTLSVKLEKNRLYLHCLDTRTPIEDNVSAVEHRVARVFGLVLKENTGQTEEN